MTQENVLEALKNVTYPGFTKDIVTFGFVKDVLVNATTVGLTIDITSSADEVKAQLRDEATKELQKLGFKDININVNTEAKIILKKGDKVWIYFENYSNKLEAEKREKFLKSGQGREL